MACLIACKIDAPAGAKPVVWRLLTRRTAITLDVADELTDGYGACREIGMFFLVLKEVVVPGRRAWA